MILWCVFLIALAAPSLAETTAIPGPPYAPPPVEETVEAISPIYIPLATTEANTQLPPLLPVYSNLPLEAPQPQVIQAIIVLPDRDRDAGTAFHRLMMQAGPLASGRSADTLILAPQFLTVLDIQQNRASLPEAGETLARWAPNAWWWGGESDPAQRTQQPVSSFEALDILASILGSGAMFPHLKQVTILGHGLGGVMTQLYGLAGLGVAGLEQKNIPVQMIVLNAPHFLYASALRPTAEGSFRRAETSLCPNVLRYPYGVDDLPPYIKRQGVAQLRMNFPERRMIYLTSRLPPAKEVPPVCAVLAQGTGLAERQNLYQNYLWQTFGPTIAQLQQFATLKTLPTPEAVLQDPLTQACLWQTDQCLFNSWAGKNTGITAD
ncbi:MAG: hypothetical protein EBZ69_04360 [Alphaproteobacteria bacterium]|nr:hypothetical protein [Alphaproteobacteria bacterium]